MWRYSPSCFLLPAALSIGLALDRWKRINSELRSELMADVSALAAHYKSVVLETHGALAVLASHPGIENAEDAAGCGRILADYRSRLQLTTGPLQNISLVSPEGIGICSAVERPGQTLNLGHLPWFRQVIENKRAAIEDYRFGQRLINPLISVAAPVFSQDGATIVAVLVAALELTPITFQLPSVTERPYTTIIFNSDGLVLFRYPEAGLIGKTVPDAPLLKEARAIVGPTVVDAIGLDGERRLAAVRKLTPDGRIFVVTNISFSDSLAPAIQLAWLQAILLLSSAIVAGAIWLIGHRSVVQPLRQFSIGARRLQAGDYGARINLHETTELQALAGTFNNMAATLEGRTAELERERAQLADTSLQLRGIIDSSPFAVVVLSDRRVVLWSRSAERLFGFSAAEVLGELYNVFIPPERASQMEALRDLVVGRKGQFTNFETQLNRKGGEIADVRMSGCRLVTPEGVSVSSLVIIEDITEEMQARRKLREATADLATVVDAAPVPIVGTDVKGDIVLWNPAAERLFGWTRDEVMGRPLPGISESRKSVILAVQARVHAGERIFAANVRRARKDGTLLDVEVSLAPVFDGGGKVRGIVGVYLDLTERNRINAQLRQSQRMEVVGQLTGGLAHDLNNLLGIVIGNLDLIHDEIGHQHSAAPMVAAAIGACMRGAQLNRSLLAFSRQQDLAPQKVDVAAVLTNMAKLMQRTLGERIKLSVTTADELSPIRVDPAQLESAILNLSVNARDAMPEGGELIIEARNQQIDATYAAQNPEAVPGDYVLVAVSDTGIGMSPDVLARVYEPFFTTKEVGQGSGLGLSMVFGFMKQSGGHVKIYSDEGLGTTVRLYFPHDTADSHASTETNGEPHARPAIPERLSVLLVEDNEDLRRVAAKELVGLGCVVEEAIDAAHALTILNSGLRPDLLLTDVVMPGELDGVELAYEAVRMLPGLRVLLTSGFTERAAQGAAPRRLPWPLLSKPFRKSELAAAIRKAMGTGVEAGESEER